MPRPGNNRRPKGARTPKNRIIWTDTVLGTFAIVRVPEDQRRQPMIDDYELEPGDNVYMEIPTFGDTYYSLDVTKLTSLELDYLEAFFARVIKHARPIVERRDDHAKQQERDGNDANPRVYRAVPQFIVRAGYE